jgi:aryl-alcohol dehydrogenase-like predicted oxidoreductase
MEYRQLGSAGVHVSVIGLGTNRFGTAQLPPGRGQQHSRRGPGYGDQLH